MGRAEQLLTVSEVARELRVSERTVRKRVASGQLPAWKLGPEPNAPVRIHSNAVRLLLRPVCPEEVAS